MLAQAAVKTRRNARPFESAAFRRPVPQGHLVCAYEEQMAFGIELCVALFLVVFPILEGFINSLQDIKGDLHLCVWTNHE